MQETRDRVADGALFFVCFNEGLCESQTVHYFFLFCCMHVDQSGARGPI